VGLTVNRNSDGGCDNEKNHDEGGVAFAGLSFGTGVMINLLGVAQQMTENHLVYGEGGRFCSTRGVAEYA
jgi:hypothetical protein